ncbi:MAG: hypothetical protein ABR922_03615, partial [Streptosporangiaceae bacterium]
GALVALAAKGGIDAVLTRQVHPRIAELPFDAEYKLMATFHKMTDESGKAVIRCLVKGAPDQLLARAATVLDPDASPVPLGGRLRERYVADTCRWERGTNLTDCASGCCICCTSIVSRALSGDDNMHHTWLRCCRTSP